MIDDLHEDLNRVLRAIDPGAALDGSAIEEILAELFPSPVGDRIKNLLLRTRCLAQRLADGMAGRLGWDGDRRALLTERIGQLLNNRPTETSHNTCDDDLLKLLRHRTLEEAVRELTEAVLLLIDPPPEKPPRKIWTESRTPHRRPGDQ